MFVFRKIWRALFSSITRFDVHPFGLLAATLLQIRQILLKNVTIILLQNAAKVYHKMRQIFYYKMRQFYQHLRR